MKRFFARRGLRAAALGLLAALALCSCSKSGTGGETEYIENPNGAPSNLLELLSDFKDESVEEPEYAGDSKEDLSNQPEVPSGAEDEPVEEPEYIGDLKEVLTNQREYRMINANAALFDSEQQMAEYNSVERKGLLKDVNRQISSSELPEIIPSRMTVLDMDMDGTVEVVLALDPDDDPGRYGFLILHWEDGEVYGYYRWYRALSYLDEAGILVSGGTVSYDPDVPGAKEAALKKHYDHYFYYFEFNGPEFTTVYVSYRANPYCGTPEVVWSDFTPENIELLVTQKAAEDVLSYPRDVFTKDAD